MSIYTLREINEMIYNLQTLIQDGTDEETIQSVLQTIEAVEMERGTKLESYAMVIKNLTNDNAGLKAEEARLAERRKHNEKAIERMKEMMAFSLQQVEPDKKGAKRIKTDKFTFSFRKSTAVEITDETAIPDEFVEVKRTISRVELKKRLAAGEEIIGAILVENQSLSIR